MDNHPTLPFLHHGEAEEWRGIVGWEALYQVSSLGRVRSLRRQTASGMRGGRILKPNINNGTRGYAVVALCDSGNNVHRLVHQLVCEAFIGPCPVGQEVLHGPGGKLDNRASILRYGTREQNLEDRVRDGQDNRGERSGHAKITWEIAGGIRRRVAAGDSQRAVALHYGITYQNVSKIVTGKSWVDADGPTQALGGIGEGNAMAKLTWASVAEIRSRCAAGESRKSLAQEFGVCRPNIDMIITRRTWKNEPKAS